MFQQPSKCGRCDLSVLICTCNRAESLRETLDCLARADRSGIRCEVVVVDNEGSSATRSVVSAFRKSLRTRYLVEAQPGKPYCLNRAIEEGHLGDIVAILDDDMSPHRDWFQGVMAMCERWPDVDIFAGNSYVVWPVPENEVPAWARRPSIRSWAYSVGDFGSNYKELCNGHWPSANQMWFRSRVLAGGRRFPLKIMLSEPRFVLDLVDEGHKMVVGPDAVAGHRVQRELLCEETVRKRAAKVGRIFAEARTKPCRRQIKHAYYLSRHPLVGRLFCAANLVRWSAAYLLAQLQWSHDDRVEASLCAIERLAFYHEILKISREVEEYRLMPPWKKQSRRKLENRKAEIREERETFSK